MYICIYIYIFVSLFQIDDDNDLDCDSTQNSATPVLKKYRYIPCRKMVLIWNDKTDKMERIIQKNTAEK